MSSLHSLCRSRFWLLCLCTGAAAILATAGAQAADKPRLNVVLIISDDLNNDLGCYGHALVKSPVIDRLAARGVRFDRAYCQFPLCNPSRVSFLSGLRPDTTQIMDLETPTRRFLKDAVFLPQYFRAHGYKTLKVGKVFHTGEGFEDPSSWDVDIRESAEAKKPPPAQIVRRQGKDQDGIALRVADEQTPDGRVAREAVSLLDKAVRQHEPFFLAAGFRRPHRPYIAPEKYFNLYPPGEIRLVQEPPGHLLAIPPAALTYTPSTRAMSDQERRETTAAYYACVSFVDAQVGVILRALDQGRLWDNTVVVFMSDHGYQLGEHGGLQHKMTLFEESARVPLIIAAPGKKANASSERLVEYVDLYPTLAALCGLPVPAGLQGTDLTPLLSDPNRPWKKAAFTQLVRPESQVSGRTVRTERWRYTEWNEGSKGVELYDHASDPLEHQNLARDPAYSAEMAQLKRLLRNGWKEALPTP